MSKPSDRKRAKQTKRREKLRQMKAGSRPTTHAQKVLKKIDKTWEAACDKAEAEGFPGEIIHAMRKTGVLVSDEAIQNGEATPQEIIDWKEAIDDYRDRHPEEQLVNEKGRRISNG